MRDLTWQQETNERADEILVNLVLAPFSSGSDRQKAYADKKRNAMIRELAWLVAYDEIARKHFGEKDTETLRLEESLHKIALRRAQRLQEPRAWLDVLDSQSRARVAKLLSTADGLKEIASRSYCSVEALFAPEET